MRKLVSISLLLFFAISCTTKKEKIVSRFPNGNPETIIIYPDKSDTTSCQIFVYYKNGNPKLTLKIEKGKYVGEKISYYRNGKIQQIDSLSQPCDTSHNSCDGTLIRYFENGSISQRYTVRNNAFNGLSQHFLSNGILAKEYELKNGMTKNGIYREFYDNGKVSFECKYQNDTIVGNEYFFKENGDTLKYYNQHNDTISFPYKKWLDNGFILYGDFTNKSEKTVTWTWFDKSGKEVKRKIAKAENVGFIAPE